MAEELTVKVALLSLVVGVVGLVVGATSMGYLLGEHSVQHIQPTIQVVQPTPQPTYASVQNREVYVPIVQGFSHSILTREQTKGYSDRAYPINIVEGYYRITIRVGDYGKNLHVSIIEGNGQEVKVYDHSDDYNRGEIIKTMYLHAGSTYISITGDQYSDVEMEWANI